MAGYCQAVVLGTLYSVNKRETKSGKPMISFAIRVFKRIGDKEKVIFIDCVAYSAIATTILENATGKDSCFVEGDLETYKDSEGKTRYQVVVKNFIFNGIDKVA